MEIAGLKVIDGKKPVEITITEADVAKGKTKDPAACAAARACLRSDACTEARVHLGRTYLKVKAVTGRQHWVRYQTPDAIRSEIIAFDRGATFTPGTYTLKPMSPANRLGTPQGSDTSKTRPKHKHVARIKHHVVSGVRHHGP